MEKSNKQSSGSVYKNQSKFKVVPSKEQTNQETESECFTVLDSQITYRSSSSSRRTDIENTPTIYLSLCQNVDANRKTIYEVMYSRPAQQFILQVYWSSQRSDAQQIYNACKEVLKEFEVPATKKNAQDLLRSIMSALKLNRHWTVAHICAKIGCENYFLTRLRENSAFLNAQIEPDRCTPLHIAIQYQRETTVKAILSLNPNVLLVEKKKNTVLHYAAISSVNILKMFLYLPETLSLMTKRNELRNTPIHLACYGQKFDNLYEMFKIGLTVRMLTVEPPECTPNEDSSFDDSANPLNRVVHLSEQDMDEFDLQDVRLGGTPLHWATGPRLMEKLLEFPFNMNSLNKIGNRPLHVMVMRSRLKCVLSLLIAGVNVNSRNILDQTALHLAVKSGDITLTQALIVFDADINAKTLEGCSVRHMAATQERSPLLYLVSYLGALRCSPETKGCAQGCSASGTNEPASHVEKLDFLNDTYDPIFKDFLHGDILRKKAKENKKPQINMLTCDGGGVKGLVTVQALMELERGLSKPLIHYFKWLAGTSTGSFIVVMLALGKSLAQVRTCYFSMKNRVSQGSKPYSGELIERLLQQHIGNATMGDLKTVHNKMVIIPSVLADRRPMRAHFYRSFQSPSELFEKHPILLRQIPNLDKDLPSKKQIPHSTNEPAWKACRCSSAAPMYFPPYGPFVDGGLTSNNPTLDALAMNQIQNAALKSLGRESEVEELDMVLAVGTGINAIEDSSEYIAVDTTISYNNFKSLINMLSLMIFETCQTEQHVMNRSEAFCYSANIAYFRLNPFVLNLFAIDEQHDSNIIATLWETKLYMYHKRTEVKLIQDYLEGRLVYPEKGVDLQDPKMPSMTKTARKKASKREIVNTCESKDVRPASKSASKLQPPKAPKNCSIIQVIKSNKDALVDNDKDKYKNMQKDNDKDKDKDKDKDRDNYKDKDKDKDKNEKIKLRAVASKSNQPRRPKKSKISGTKVRIRLHSNSANKNCRNQIEKSKSVKVVKVHSAQFIDNEVSKNNGNSPLQ